MKTETHRRSPDARANPASTTAKTTPATSPRPLSADYFNRAILPKHGPRVGFSREIALNEAPTTVRDALKKAAAEILYDQRQTTTGRVKIHEVAFFAMSSNEGDKNRTPVAYAVSGRYEQGSQRRGAFTIAFEPNGKRVFYDVELR